MANIFNNYVDLFSFCCFLDATEIRILQTQEDNDYNIFYDATERKIINMENNFLPFFSSPPCPFQRTLESGEERE